MSLEGQIALVTGSSRGLGLAIAKALKSQGCKVIINYLRSKEAAEKAASELQTIAIKADVTNREQVCQLFNEAEKRFGLVTIVVNNALGEFQFNGDGRQKLHEIHWDDFDKQLQTTVQGAFHTTQAAIPGFRRRGYGRIINIGTNLVQNPVVPYHDYTTAKGALLAFTHTTAAELGPMGVTCNMVSGGLLKMTDASAATPAEIFEQIAAVTPMRRVATPEDLAGAVLFFAGPHASCVTGQQIIVDGGLCMT